MDKFVSSLLNFVALFSPICCPIFLIGGHIFVYSKWCCPMYIFSICCCLMLIQRRGGVRGADPNGSVYAGAIHFPAQSSNHLTHQRYSMLISPLFASSRGLDAQLFHFANKNHVRKPWSGVVIAQQKWGILPHSPPWFVKPWLFNPPLCSC